MAPLKSQMTPKFFKPQVLNKSKGIFSGYAVRKSIETLEGTITKVPEKELDFTNKGYVDGLIRGNIDLFLTEDGSDIGTYLDLTTDSTGNPEEDTTQTITGNSTTLIASYATILNEPEIEAITDLEGGIYSLHLHALSNFPNNMAIYFEFYRRTSLGVETLLGTSHDSDTLTLADAEYELHANIATDLMWDTGDRVVVKVYGRNGNAASKDITIFVEGDTLSRVEFPAFIPPTFVASHVTSHETGGTDPISHDSIDDVSADDHHAQTHTIVSHDTTATGANLTELTNGSDTTLHDHDGISENTAARHGVNDANSSSEPVKGADDNYVTDAQLIVIGNTSGTNTGDQNDHDALDNVSIDDHHAQSHNAASHSDITASGADIDDAVTKKHASGSDDQDISGIGTNAGNIATNVTAIGLNTTHRGSAGGTDHSDVNTNNAKVSYTDAADVTANTNARHAESHTVVSHDTTATGAELNSLTDDSMVDTKHRHSELSASDGTPNAVLTISANGDVAIGAVPQAGVKFCVTEDQDGQTFMVLDNANSGVGARTAIQIRQNNVIKLNMQYNNQSPNVWIYTTGSSPLYLGANSGIDLSIDATHDATFGGTNAQVSSKVEIRATDKAFLLTRITTTARNALTATNGMLIYNTTDNKFQGYENGAWANLI